MICCRTKVHVDWPSLAITVPTRIETFTLDVAVSVSFTNNVCGPVSVRGNNNNQRVLRGDYFRWILQSSDSDMRGTLQAASAG